MVDPRDVLHVSRDPDDDKFLACARAAEADTLVTEDRDPLVLETYGDTRTCQPAEFIAWLETNKHLFIINLAFWPGNQARNYRENTKLFLNKYQVQWR
jgi:hypothetical protein